MLSAHAIGGDEERGKLAVLDISESGGQIIEKLLVLLAPRQQQEAIQYIMRVNEGSALPTCCITPFTTLKDNTTAKNAEIRINDLFFSLESRIVRICGKDIILTAKEFDIFALLITNPYRVFSHETIMAMVWQEPYDYYSRKTISNHVSNLCMKLKVTPHSPDYIKNVRCVGYKFNTDLL